MTRHMLGLFTGRPGARAYRRHLATEAPKPGAGLEVLRDAVAHVARASDSLDPRALRRLPSNWRGIPAPTED